MTGTYSVSESSTYTEARARYVLGKAYDDIVGLACVGAISADTGKKWYEELKYILDLEALKKFEFKVTYGDRVPLAWKYEVFSDGSISEDGESGGVDMSKIPSGASATVTVDLTNTAGTEQEALDYLRGQGWGTGAFLDVRYLQDRSYSKEGFGIRRSIFSEGT